VLRTQVKYEPQDILLFVLKGLNKIMYAEKTLHVAF